MGHFLYQLKRVKPGELLQVWKLPIGLLCGAIYRKRHKDLWIVCEDANEARDNGIWFFRYVREHFPEQECVYAIRNTSPDYQEVAALGPTVSYGSLKHWILYLASSKKVSSQKAGNPNAAIFYFLEVYGLLKDKRIFLQHGVIRDDLKWLYYDVTRMDRFICGAAPEYRFVRDTFGYPPGHVVYTGLCRFDGLHDHASGDPENSAGRRLVLIMPTWREWIADEDERLERYEGTRVISETNYFRTWNRFLKDPRIHELAQTYHVRFVFFPHRNMQKYMEYFPESDECMEIADAGNYTVQELLKGASMMVTDYSSVFVDMLYMKKPVVLYQFDLERFREAQYGEGYFHYDDNPFARSIVEAQDVFDEIERYIREDFQVSAEYLKAHAEFFELYDDQNCKRVYDVVREL